METQEYIEKYQKIKLIDSIKYKVIDNNYIVAGYPIVKCRDALMLNKKYKGIRLSDIYIFDPNYIVYLQNNKYIPKELKEIANEIDKIQSAGMDDISRQIALGK